MAAWCERWNIKINENKARMIYISHRTRPPDSLPFVNSVKYLGLIFFIIIIIIIILLQTASGFSPGGSCTTKRHTNKT
jgi:hypothetical protein